MTAAEAVPESHPTVFGTLRDMPRTVRVLVLGNLISNLAAFLNAFLVLFLKGQGMSAREAGWVLTALMVGRVAGMAVGGSLADRIGNRAVITGSMLTTGALTVVLVHVTNPWVSAAVAVATGVTALAFRPAAMAVVVEQTPENSQVMVFSILRLTFNVGSTLGPLAAAALLSFYSYDVLFYADGATSALFGVVALMLLPKEPRHKAASREAKPAEQGGYVQVLTDMRFLLVVAGLFLCALTYIQMTASLPLFVTASGHSNRVYAVLLALNGFVVIAFEVLLSKWTQKLPVGIPMALGIGLLGLGYLMYAGPTPVTYLVLATLVWTLGEVVAAPSMMAYPGMVSPPALRARYIAAANVPQQVGYSIGPVIGIAMWQAWGKPVWLVMGGCALVGALMVIAGAPLRRTPEPAPAPAAAEPLIDVSPERE